MAVPKKKRSKSISSKKRALIINNKLKNNIFLKKKALLFKKSHISYSYNLNTQVDLNYQYKKNVIIERCLICFIFNNIINKPCYTCYNYKKFHTSFFWYCMYMDGLYTKNFLHYLDTDIIDPQMKIEVFKWIRLFYTMFNNRPKFSNAELHFRFYHTNEKELAFNYL